MIRLIQRRLIIPRGDTGSFSIPVIKSSTDNIAVFTIFDETTKTRMFQKMIQGEGDVLNIAFTHSDTVNLKPGKYVWDIKYYSNPEFIDDELVNGEEIDSYYAGFTLPVCEIRETADNYLVSPDAPDAKLSPEQLEIVTGAIHSLNEAIRKTQENVEHYPEIRDEVWYVWDAELGDYVSTGVRANGIVGNGIASAVLNDDYTLTLNFTDGTSFTSSSIRGETGNGIDDIVLNNDFTLTISYTDGGSYTTPSIRGPVGATPQFSIGTVQDGAVAAASITGTAENPVLNLTLPNAHVPTRVSQLENDANYAVDANYVHTDNNYTTAEKNKLNGIAAGAEVNVNADWNAVSGDAQILNKPINVSAFNNDAGYLTTETDPTVPAWAKTAQKPSYTAAEVGAPTVAEMNTAIGTAIGNINSFDIAVVQALPTQNISTHTIYLVPKTGETNDVYDEYVYINNNWEMVGNTQIDLSNYVQKTDYATNVEAGVVKVFPGYGIYLESGFLTFDPAQTNLVKSGSSQKRIIAPYNQHEATFYGLAKAAGDTTQSASDNAVGTYTDEAKAAIQQMLDVPSKSGIPDMSIYAEKTEVLFEKGTGIGSVKTKDFEFGGITFSNEANGLVSYAEGLYTVSSGQDAHAEGYATRALGMHSHTEGLGTIASGPSVHVSGTYNVDDEYENLPEWESGVSYAIGDKVKITTTNSDNTVKITGYMCKTANSDVEFTKSNWSSNPKLNYAEIIGNGTSNARSNAYALTWEGDGKYAGDVYVHANSDSSGGNKLITASEAPVQDVQVNGASILDAQGVANVPIANSMTHGVVKVFDAQSYGVRINSGGALDLYPISSARVKEGEKNYLAINPARQHESVFYGLAKAAGADMKDIANTTVGIYPDAQKEAIQSMLGITQMLAPENPNLVATQAYAIGDVFTANGHLYKATAAIAQNGAIIPDTNCVETTMVDESVRDVQIAGSSVVGSDGIANIPIANTNTLGVVKVTVSSGLHVNNDGTIATTAASSSGIKTGNNANQVIVPQNQHEAAFYGLSKVAGVNLANETVTLGTYPEASKTAIKTMLGVEEGMRVVRLI